MVKRIFLLIPIILLLALALALWAPWMTRLYAEKRAEQAFTASWQGVMDGCGLNCKNCGAKNSQKTWFGYQVKIEYACGLLPEDTAQYHQIRTGFVSFLGTVHGFPKP
jgi:hypothetical protein